MICSMECSDREDSVVYVEGCPEGTQYFVLTYAVWPTEDVGLFNCLLSSLLPAGSRWYGGFFRKVIGTRASQIREYREECLVKDFVDVWNSNEKRYEDRWIEVLVDFGCVETKSRIDPEDGSLSVLCVEPNVSPCRGEERCDNYEANDSLVRSLGVMELQTAYGVQKALMELDIVVSRFGSVLLEEYQVASGE